ncbi:uncharacterized protein MICPUCDRAFT_54990 [Micromonas pusilla CCMP1545]|uniref:Predicted protein n=1 Tax=Micromonas pusilla (strain CCMP1545) TaxID=564608 RepID=C1MJK2_MICPC|nr:uncharacterized protein MICPUCDRAFT_54990 [Micromonas pusilla CCMP1545]EEH59211.1 predicted protein [Micromonas pusilla CCMP1545]|eukprot:XP_003055835.1 predicted protein [Micromonas pusilla CCMP1545]
MAAVRASPLGAVASRANPRARASSMVGGRPRVVVAIARPRASNRRRVASASADASSSSGALAVSYRTDADGAVVYRFGGEGDDDDDDDASRRARGEGEDERGSSDFEILRAADGSVMFRFADAAADASAAVNNVVTRVEDDVAATATATAAAAAAATATTTTTKSLRNGVHHANAVVREPVTTTVGEKAEERQKISAGKTAAAGAVAAPPPARPPPRGGGSADALRPLPPALRRMSELGVRTVLDGVESAFETVRRVLSSRRFPFVRRSPYDRVRVVNFIP